MSSQRLSKVAVAIGGFLIFTGIIMFGVFALIFLGIVDKSILENLLESEGYGVLFLEILLIIGILDITSGIILKR